MRHQREPRPISWPEQRALLPKLPDHLARMSLFVLNTGVRDDVACSLRWEAAGLGDLHVHDLRHTVGMRLREAGIPEGTISDLLWHSTRSMTHHYSVAQIVELHGALEKIRADDGTWNKSLQTLRLEQEATRGRLSPPKVPTQRTTA